MDASYRFHICRATAGSLVCWLQHLQRGGCEARRAKSRSRLPYSITRMQWLLDELSVVRCTL
jgi:hypothetical protein